MNFYNEIDDYCGDWLEALIRAKHIPDGVVDRRDIRDILPRELAGYRQCHFFAGLGGWPLALKLAGVEPDEPLWTGSCPCQPFSAAGKRGGFADERHLWPYWQYLIEQCRPAKVFGEQVASAAEWLRLVRGDLEAMGYAVGAIPVEAASAGADHLRDRYWFVADADDAGSQGRGLLPERSGEWVAWPDGLADAIRRDGLGEFSWVAGADGKSRRVKSGIRLLAHGVPARVAKLRALGNAIDPRAAAEFIRAALNL